MGKEMLMSVFQILVHMKAKLTAFRRLMAIAAVADLATWVNTVRARETSVKSHHFKMVVPVIMFLEDSRAYAQKVGQGNPVSFQQMFVNQNRAVQMRYVVLIKLDINVNQNNKDVLEKFVRMVAVVLIE